MTDSKKDPDDYMPPLTDWEEECLDRAWDTVRREEEEARAAASVSVGSVIGA